MYAVDRQLPPGAPEPTVVVAAMPCAWPKPRAERASTNADSARSLFMVVSPCKIVLLPAPLPPRLLSRAGEVDGAVRDALFRVPVVLHHHLALVCDLLLTALVADVCRFMRAARQIFVSETLGHVFYHALRLHFIAHNCAALTISRVRMANRHVL